jgi:hypothetical protein
MGHTELQKWEGIRHGREEEIEAGTQRKPEGEE